MSNFRYLGRLSGGPEAYYSGVTDLTVGLDAAGARLYAITRDGGGLSAFGLKDGPEAPSLLSQAGFGGQVAPLRVPGLSMLDTGAGPVLQPTGLLAGGQSAHWLTAAGIGARVSASGAQAPADLLALVQVVAGGRAYAVGSRAGEEAPRLYALGADGGLTEADGRLADRAGPARPS